MLIQYWPKKKHEPRSAPTMMEHAAFNWKADSQRVAITLFEELSG